MDAPESRSVEELIASQAPEDLIAAASDRRLNEDSALALLKQRDLPTLALERLAKNASAMKHRRVLVGIVTHPRTPRFVSLPVVQRLFSFELMQISISPAVATDVKIAADRAITSRL